MLVFVFRLLARLPLVWVHRLGALAGWLAWHGSARHRHTLRANLTRAVGEARARELLPEAIVACGQQILELAWVWQRPLDEVLAKIVRVEGEHYIRDAQAAGHSILALTPHLGCFDLCATWLGTHIGPCTVLYRPPRQQVLEPILIAGRERGQTRVAAANASGVRLLVRALRRGEIAGMLPDQTPKSGDGIWATFFGAPAWTMTLAARMSEIRNVDVLMMRTERLPHGAGYVIHIRPPAQPVQGDLAARAQAINHAIEAEILASPAQYLWAYPRYKVPGEAAPLPPEFSTPAA